ncbi:MAG: NifU family protein [Bacilli bacterium]|jgi:Fe-S cluster biogenesis protein NfuA|nr:NifU family protein [Bacilli bacterium]
MSENKNPNIINQEIDHSQDEIIAQIKEVLAKLATFIQRDGGDISFQGWDPSTGTVYVALTGACQGCMYIDTTLYDGVEAILQEEIPGVNAVREIGGQASL